ncbi:MAG TPA: flagellar basal body L-ring protein FlgH [Hyphomicrobiales bacterium]|nr:flagellar basal body L-ring protein FlgH [Hyphomicrobiales bacterium]
MPAQIPFLPHRAATFLALAGALLLGACASSRTPDPDEGVVYQRAAIMDVARPHANGGIYNASGDIRLFEDIKARHVGDILTIMLVESTSGSKSSDTSLSKSSSVAVSPPVFGDTLRQNIALNMDSDNAFAGESGSTQRNSLSGSIAVTITEVLPNGNLVVQGEKWIEINQGKEYIRLHGVVRPRDVRPNNTLYSTQVADARISYSGTGATASTNVVGWAARLVFSSLFPF